MELLKVLGMPFQAASLLFVAITSLFMAMILNTQGVFMLFGLPAAWLITTWLTQFAFTLIDDAANGVKETATASVEMLSPWGDSRCWIHPFLAVLIAVFLMQQPAIPRWTVLLPAAVLFPASVGSVAMTGRALDALNPLLMIRVMRGLGHYYPLAVLGTVLCAGLGLLALQLPLWTSLRLALLQLLLLMVYALIGGAIFIRRLDLGFEPLASPEREKERGDQQHIARRQQMIDGLYHALRVRRHAEAVASARQWIEQATTGHLHGDVQAILDAGARWSEPRGFAQLLREVVPQLLSKREPALAFAAVEAALAAAPGFTPEKESDAVAMISYAMQTGRKRVAATLLKNFTDSTPDRTPGPELMELRARL